MGAMQWRCRIAAPNGPCLDGSGGGSGRDLNFGACVVFGREVDRRSVCESFSAYLFAVGLGGFR